MAKKPRFNMETVGTNEEQLRCDVAALLQEMFVDYRRIMRKWANRTGQSAQLDSGYIAQHLLSLLTGKKGSGMRGKGFDLEDGSEVKCACSVDGKDVPRWNHNFPTPQKIEEWLDSPAVYYVLFDTRSKDIPQVRFRIWTVQPKTDEAYQTVLSRWKDKKTSKFPYFLQPIHRALPGPSHNSGAWAAAPGMPRR